MARHDVSSETREGGVHRNGKEKELLYLDTNIRYVMVRREEERILSWTMDIGGKREKESKRCWKRKWTVGGS